MPEAETRISAAGEIRSASTAAVPTTRPPMMETGWETAFGADSPASCSSSKARSRPTISTAVGKGTERLLSMIASRSWVGSIS